MELPSIEELRTQILLAPITDMEPHIKRGGFVLISPTLDLAETAHAIAANNEALIQQHITNGLLNKGDQESYTTWKEEKIFFHFIVVSPFVVAQKFVELNPPPKN